MTQSIDDSTLYTSIADRSHSVIQGAVKKLLSRKYHDSFARQCSQCNFRKTIKNNEQKSKIIQKSSKFKLAKETDSLSAAKSREGKKNIDESLSLEEEGGIFACALGIINLLCCVNQIKMKTRTNDTFMVVLSHCLMIVGLFLYFSDILILESKLLLKCINIGLLLFWMNCF